MMGSWLPVLSCNRQKLASSKHANVADLVTMFDKQFMTAQA